MQLADDGVPALSRKKGKSIAASLATATCALLGTTSTTPVQAQEDPKWEFNTALLYYGESDGRIEDISFNMLMRRNFVDDRFLSVSIAIDTLTGATPVGAIPFDGPLAMLKGAGAEAFLEQQGLQHWCYR